MRKKVLATVCTLTIMISLFMTASADAKAFENKKSDGSYLTHNDYAIDRINSGVQIRGTHLMDGECSITKAGRGKIYVYASTTGNHDVDYISTVIYIDRYNEKTNSWGQIDFWQVEDKNTYYVSTSKTMTVERGYYYRVHADHVAGMIADYPYEEATTLTDGIWID